MIRTAVTLLQEEQCSIPIVTFCESLDSALAGGIQTGRLTEVCGVPGIGKTQLCMQLACDVQIPQVLGGLGGEAVYVDTSGGLMVDRLADIAAATVDHCRNVTATCSDNGELSKQITDFTERKVLNGIHTYVCQNHQQLLATVQVLPEFLTEHKQVKLVMFDSIAAHFRHEFDDFLLRTQLLTSLAQALICLARKYQIAVVVTNQMTTRIQKGENGSHLVPALGQSWGHACTSRIILQWHGDCRMASIYKSAAHPQALVPYQITMDGVRDIDGHLVVEDRCNTVDSHTDVKGVFCNDGAKMSSSFHGDKDYVNGDVPRKTVTSADTVHEVDKGEPNTLSISNPNKRQRIT